MPVFAYKGLDAQGKEVKGLLDAESAKTLRSQLRKEGIRIVEHREEGDKADAKSKGKATASSLGSVEVDLKKYLERISVAEIALTTRQLATLLKSGITLIEALTAIVDQVDNQKLKRVYGAIKSDVNEGSSLADAMGNHPKVFNHLYVNMIRAGEASGSLDQVLLRLADFTESQARLKARVMNAMMYPLIMISIGSLLVLLIFVVVIPRILKVFEQVKAELPIQTKVLIFVANTLRDDWWALIMIAGAAIYFFRRWKNSKAGREKWDRFVLAAPIFGTVVRMIAVTRFARTLATLLRSGVPVLTALDIVREVLDNTRLAEVVGEAREAIREGESIAAPLKRSKEFPPILVHMVAIGEASGQLEHMLENVADNYDFQVNSRVDALTTLIEPMMIVGMGLGVGYIVWAILLPILQLSQHVH